MKTVKLLYTKSQVDKAGELLKKSQGGASLLAEPLETLSNWRAYHAAPLDTFAKVLRVKVKKISRSNNAIVAQRLKRTPSILLKLQTHKTMRFSAMQDIGGLRAILDTVEEVYTLLEQYRTSRTKHFLSVINDYISMPKSDGYRGVHLVYKLTKTSDIFLEIQIRSYLQHIWATGVEVFGTLQNSSFKSGYGDDKWFEFFALLSSVFSVKEETAPLDKHRGLSTNTLLKRTKKMIQHLRVIEQLSAYTSLYKVELIKSLGGRRGNYGLILLNSRENTVNISAFSANQLEEVTVAYLDLEKKYFNDDQVNVVLVNSGDIKKLELSYPNYFMDTKILVRKLSLIVMDKYL